MHVNVEWKQGCSGVWSLRIVPSERTIAAVQRSRKEWYWRVDGLRSCDGTAETLREAKTTCESECGVTKD